MSGFRSPFEMYKPEMTIIVMRCTNGGFSSRLLAKKNIYALGSQQTIDGCEKWHKRALKRMVSNKKHCRCSHHCRTTVPIISKAAVSAKFLILRAVEPPGRAALMAVYSRKP